MQLASIIYTRFYQVVDFGENGPVRCSRCKGYINPFMKFVDQGKHFICNFCGFTDETPRDYHCNLGPAGRRRDADERPELCIGTIDFVASKEYMALGDVYGSGVSEIELGTAQRTGVKAEVERPSNSAREKGFNMPAREERVARRSDFDRYTPGGFNDLRASRSTIAWLSKFIVLCD